MRTLDLDIGKWRIRALILLHHVVAFFPALIIALVYALSWRAQLFIGSWPRPTFDDPKIIVSGDWLYELLYTLAWLLVLSVCFTIPAFVYLTRVLWDKYPRLWTFLLIVIFAVGIILLRLDPGQRIAWYMD